MIVIGEKINGSIPSVAAAIAARDAEEIKARAIAQTEAGATFIDCCASVEPEVEIETLKWMIDTIQSVTDLPIAVDSPSDEVLAEIYSYCNKPGLVNSVSGEGNKCDTIFSKIADTDWEVAALLSDDSGIPKTAADRLKVFDYIMEKAKQYNIAPSRIHIDPLIEMLCTSDDGIAMNEEVISTIRKAYPDIHITAAISNISFNLPVRKLVNQGFTILTILCGLDSGIFDPLNKDLMGLIKATETILAKGEVTADLDLRAIEAEVGEANAKYVLPAYAVLGLKTEAIEWEEDEDGDPDLQKLCDELLAKDANTDYGARDLLGLLYATMALMGEDFMCTNYIAAYRDDVFGPVKK